MATFNEWFTKLSSEQKSEFVAAVTTCSDFTGKTADDIFDEIDAQFKKINQTNPSSLKRSGDDAISEDMLNDLVAFQVDEKNKKKEQIEKIVKKARDLRPGVDTLLAKLAHAKASLESRVSLLSSDESKRLEEIKKIEEKAKKFYGSLSQSTDDYLNDIVRYKNTQFPDFLQNDPTQIDDHFKKISTEVTAILNGANAPATPAAIITTSERYDQKSEDNKKQSLETVRGNILDNAHDAHKTIKSAIEAGATRYQEINISSYVANCATANSTAITLQVEAKLKTAQPTAPSEKHDITLTRTLNDLSGSKFVEWKCENKTLGLDWKAQCTIIAAQSFALRRASGEPRAEEILLGINPPEDSNTLRQNRDIMSADGQTILTKANLTDKEFEMIQAHITAGYTRVVIPKLGGGTFEVSTGTTVSPSPAVTQSSAVTHATPPVAASAVPASTSPSTVSVVDNNHLAGNSSTPSATQQRSGSPHRIIPDDSSNGTEMTSVSPRNGGSRSP